jgi:CRP/FNR family cyclic AMP-dependent transcriptional regulator
MVAASKQSFDVTAFGTRYGGVTVYKYREGHVVYTQGNPARALYYIQKGKIQLTVVSGRGKERVVAVLEDGDFLGEGCLTEQLARISSAATMSATTIARLEKAAVARALHEDVSFSEFFVTYLLGRNNRLTSDLIDQLLNSSEKRLARILLLLAHYGDRDRHDVNITAINQQTLAKMVGTTRSRINFFMNKFRRLGYLDYNGGISVHPSLLKVVLNDQSPNDDTFGQSGTPSYETSGK